MDSRILFLLFMKIFLETGKVDNTSGDSGIGREKGWNKTLSLYIYFNFKVVNTFLKVFYLFYF